MRFVLTIEADVNKRFFEECLYTQGCGPLDFVVRTSGEVRLSDFLLWQVSENASVHFLDCLWPEIKFYDFLLILLRFQGDFLTQKQQKQKLK